MVSTITPMVHGGSRKRWLGSLGVHILGGALGGAAAVTVLSLLLRWVLPSPGVRHWVAWVLVVILFMGELFMGEAGFRKVIPSPHRQVSKRTRERLGPDLTAFLYGAELGVGFITRVPYSVTYAALTGAALVLPPSLGAIVGMAFGAARGSSVWPAVNGTTLERLELASSRRFRWAVSPRLASVFGTMLAMVLLFPA